MDLLLKYFPGLTERQKEQFAAMPALYAEWNDKINVVSRKDINNLYERHVIHSLGIAKVQAFRPGSSVMDVGTGGGFPGIPLAVLFPETSFHLVDSIGKKIKVVENVASSLGLQNVRAEQIRAEQVAGTYDFIVSRAVTELPAFVKWVRSKISPHSAHELRNGILYLKGGDLAEELRAFGSKPKIYNLSDFFSEEFFETKKVVYLPLR